MQAEVELLAGEYTGGELCTHLAHTLTHAAWADNVHMPIAKGSNRRNPSGHGLPMEWVCGLDDAGRLYLSSHSYTFFRFELTFQSPHLPAFLGLQVSPDLRVRSAEVVRQHAHLTQGWRPPCHEPGDAEDDTEGGATSGANSSSSSRAMSLFVSTLRGSVPLQHEEARMQCFKESDLAIRAPWSGMSDAALEVGTACFEWPLARESAVLVRDSAWMHDKMLAVAIDSAEIGRSVAQVLGFARSSSCAVECEPLDGQLMRMAQALPDAPTHLARSRMRLYTVKFRQYTPDTDAQVERFESVLQQLAHVRRCCGLKALDPPGLDCRFGRALPLKELVPSMPGAGGGGGDREAVLQDEVATDDLQALKWECYRWWLLLREAYDKFITSCPHRLPLERCGEAKCIRLLWAATNEELVLCDIEVRRAREAAGLSLSGAGSRARFTLAAASMAGVEFETEDFARTAAEVVYEMVLARAPATPLLPLTAAVEPLPVRLVNPTDAVAAEEDAERRRELEEKRAEATDKQRADSMPLGMLLPLGLPCRTLYTHLNLRSAQKALCERLARGFLKPAGGSRDAAVRELERNSTGPATSLPPLVTLCGPPGSGKTRVLAHVRSHSPRCSAQRELVRHMTSSKFASHYTTARLPSLPYPFRLL